MDDRFVSNSSDEEKPIPLRRKTLQLVEDSDSKNGEADRNAKEVFLEEIWPRLERDYQRMSTELAKVCKAELSNRSIPIPVAVEDRVKSRKSILKSLQRREIYRNKENLGMYRDLHDILGDLHDLVGIRIIVEYLDHLKDVSDFVTGSFNQEKEPNRFHANRKVGNWWQPWFGAYECMNHHISSKFEEDNRLSTYNGVMFEIQVTSLPANMYNKIAHPLLYKEEVGPLSQGEEIVVDITKGLAYCYSLCLHFKRSKLNGTIDKQDDIELLRNIPSASGELDEPSINLLAGRIPELDVAAGRTMEIPRESLRMVLDSLLNDKIPDDIGQALVDKLSREIENIGFQEIAKGYQDVLKEHCDIAKEQLQAQKGLAEERLSEEQQKCHQLFRLTTSNRDATYEWYKERTEERVENTCMWFLKHEHFRSWLSQESGPLLVSADPGCGKSVLAKYLIDQGLPRSATICYFFFKSQDQDTTRQALCALLHQLFSLKPPLIEHAIPRFRENGENLINITSSLWKILQDAVKDARTGPVIIVLDALDECVESELADLMRHVQSQFGNNHSEYRKLKYLLTCRPYDQILSGFWGLLKEFPNIHILGEDKSETISQEVNHVITCRINQLALQKNLSAQIKSHLKDKLREASHRTYLWVYLVFDYLERANFKKTPKGIELAVATLPGSVNEAYERILSKTNEEPMVRRVLNIILAARRPLSLSEMNIAINIGYKSKSIDDLDLEDDKDFKTRLRSLCGLFVSIHHGSVYFLHQTACEFLLADLTSSPATLSKFHWHRSFTTRQAHTTLAEICVLFLNFLNLNSSLFTSMRGVSMPIRGSKTRRAFDTRRRFDTRRAFHSTYKGQSFFDYSAENWGPHVREADFMADATIIPFVLAICDTGSRSYLVYSQYLSPSLVGRSTALMVASLYGHHTITKILLKGNAEIEAPDRYGQTPLLLATTNGHDAIVKLLLEKGADIEAKHRNNTQTLLSFAATSGAKAIVKLLLKNGADTEAKDRHLPTTLWKPDNYLRNAIAKRAYEDIAELLLEKFGTVKGWSRSGETPLLAAARRGYYDIVKLLLEKGAVIECEDRYGQTPLFAAANRGYNDIVELLLEKGAAVECPNIFKTTPLLVAAQKGYDSIVKQLLDKGASVESEDSFGLTAMLCAQENGHEAVMNILGTSRLLR